MTSLSVSIIIPAYNAAKTIAETLESVRAQALPDWEAIVINDGSSDATAAIATSFAAQDARIRVVSQPQMGASVARNTGIDLAQYDWLLFLDADDWILPTYLERLTAILASDPKLDAAQCGYVSMTSEREPYGPECRCTSSNLFAKFAQDCALAIHACIVRKTLVQAVGGFDPALLTCEDWDLWQRIARTGARFGETQEVLAHYRIRIGSLSTKAFQNLTDGLLVIAQGHAPDPRVLDPDPDYAQGQPIELISKAKLKWACWCAGVAISYGEDPRPFLTQLQDVRNPELLGIHLLRRLLTGLQMGTYPPLTESHKLWPSLVEPINEFLVALEKHFAVTGLVRLAHSMMERIILTEAVVLRPVTVGATHAVRVEVTEPISDLFLPEPAERLYCTVELEGERLGSLELPIFEGMVSSRVIGDAIAAKFSWTILGRFFERLVYPNFTLTQESSGLTLQRGSLYLTEGLSEGTPFWRQAHDQIGWTVFLQELWGRPDWTQEVFSDQQATEPETSKRWVTGDRLVVEISDELFDVEVSGNSLEVVVTVGGVAIGGFPMTVQPGVIRAQKLRSALLLECGFELCRAAVREGLLGRPMAESASLRERLAEAAAIQRSQDTSELKASVPGLTPNSAHALSQVLSLGKSAMIFGCRMQEAIGTSASRWAMLSTAAIKELTEAAQVAGEPLIQVPETDHQPEHVFYVPDLILHSFRSQRSSKTATVSSRDKVKHTICYDRGYFETTFAQSPDPYNYTNPYEQTKYEQTLSLLPPQRIKRALELACAEGHFTVQLAPCVDSLIAADISQIAVNRAAECCAELKNVSFMRLDLLDDPLPGCFELIVCSEVLYNVGELENLQAVARKFVDALEPGGHLLTAHANLVVDEPNCTGYNWDHPFGAKIIGETLSSTPGLCLVKEIHTPLYRVQLFQREPHGGFPEGLLPEVIEIAQSTLPPPTAAEEVLWSGGLPERTPEISILTHTKRLPILMYHRVAPTGSPQTDRWRVTPEAFEEQLRYLQDAGVYSVTLEDWRIAMATRTPLPGRAVLITFDDGYLDFLTYAWPLLKRYGFTATVFLAVDHVGQSNRWDQVYGEDIPLLGWQEIKQLQAEGVEFGSHSASHRSLISLSFEEVVREAARSRTILEQELGNPIRAFAYPYGDFDPVVEHLIGACGYVFGLSCQPGRSCFQDSLLALPRIDIEGSDSLQEFVVKFSP